MMHLLLWFPCDYEMAVAVTVAIAPLGLTARSATVADAMRWTTVVPHHLEACHLVEQAGQLCQTLSPHFN